MTTNKDHKKCVPCTCLKGGFDGDEKVCEKCNGIEWVCPEKPKPYHKPMNTKECETHGKCKKCDCLCAVVCPQHLGKLTKIKPMDTINKDQEVDQVNKVEGDVLDLIEKEIEIFDKRPKSQKHIHPDGECYMNDIIKNIQQQIKNAEIKVRQEMKEKALGLVDKMEEKPCMCGAYKTYWCEYNKGWKRAKEEVKNLWQDMDI